MEHSPKIPLPNKKKISLVLSGGGTKAAAFHIGVAYALREAGFEVNPKAGHRKIETLIGSSGGSFIATVLAAGYSLENISASFLGQQTQGIEGRLLPRLNYKKMFKIRPEIAKEQIGHFLLMKNMMASLMEGKFPSLLQLRWLRLTGLFSTYGLEQFLREEVLPYNSFHDYDSELFIVATHLNDSRKVIFGKKEYPAPPHDTTAAYRTDVSISEAVAASAALPVVFAPYSISSLDGTSQYYMDGEIRETLSTHVAIDAGADLVFTSYTHQPYRYVPEVGSLTQLGLPAIVIQGIYILIEQKINTAYESYRSKKSAMNEVYRYLKDQDLHPDHAKKVMEILEKELHQSRDIDIIPIHPDPSDTQTFLAEHFTLNPKKLTENVKAGYKAAKKSLARYDLSQLFG